MLLLLCMQPLESRAKLDKLSSDNAQSRTSFGILVADNLISQLQHGDPDSRCTCMSD